LCDKARKDALKSRQELTDKEERKDISTSEASEPKPGKLRLADVIQQFDDLTKQMTALSQHMDSTLSITNDRTQHLEGLVVDIMD
jgi:hypothetical protein